jgi:hypothetical protein
VVAGFRAYRESKSLDIWPGTDKASISEEVEAIGGVRREAFDAREWIFVGRVYVRLSLVLGRGGYIPMGEVGVWVEEMGSAEGKVPSRAKMPQRTTVPKGK